jgi:AcrR family transcriptional regulator
MAEPERDTPREQATGQIVAAARECFARLGVHRTRMEDIAAAAGVVRQSVYRHVSGREELVELALLERCREFSVELRRGTDLTTSDLPRELVDLVARSIAIGRNDEEFVYLAEALPRRLGSFLTGPGSPTHQIVYDTYEPLITEGHRRALIRDDVSDHDLVEWIQGIITLFAPREDLSDFEERRRLRAFLIPAIFKP